MRIFRKIRLWFGLRINGFKRLLVRKLGGETKVFVAVPTYRDTGHFTELDWHQMVGLPTQCPALFRYLNKNMEQMEHELYRLPETPEFDRKRLYFHTIMETYQWFMRIPENSLKAIARIEDERKKKSVKMTNLGEDN